jgi:hypothetical protein
VSFTPFTSTTTGDDFVAFSFLVGTVLLPGGDGVVLSAAIVQLFSYAGFKNNVTKKSNAALRTHILVMIDRCINILLL